MLKIADYICLGSAKHSEDFTGIRLLNHIYLGHNRGTSIDVLLSGVSPLTLLNAVRLNYIKAFGKCEQASTPTPASPVDIVANNGAIKVKDDELPIGYKRLLNVYFDGDSYFETGEKLTGNDVVTMTLQADSSAGQNVFGSYSGTGASAINLSLYVYTSASSQSYFRSNKTLLRPTLGTGKRTISFGNGSTSGFLRDVTYDVEEFETTDTAQIGALPNSSSPKFAGYFYGNITISNRLKYIPCERVSDSAIGYYETVNGGFLENQGTGTLTTSGYDTSHLTEIYYDGTVETVQAHGKNLLNPSEIDRYTVTQLRWYYQDGYLLKAGKTYTLSTNYTGCYLYFMRKSDNTSLINSQNSVSYTPTEDVLVYFRAYKSPSLEDGYNYQLELGSTATDYEPYFEGNTATCQPLLSVGTYKDVQNITNGAITRNVGIKVLDGTENWQDHGTYSEIKTLYATGTYAGSAQAITSTHYVGTSASNANMPVDSIKLSRPSASDVNGTIYIKTDSLTLADFKAWLASQYAAGTPVIVVYPLATPTTEAVTGQTLTITQGTNIVTATGSVDDLELEISYKAYAEVTVEEIEAVNTDENVEVTIS